MIVAADSHRPPHQPHATPLPQLGPRPPPLLRCPLRNHRLNRPRLGPPSTDCPLSTPVQLRPLLWFLCEPFLRESAMVAADDRRHAPRRFARPVVTIAQEMDQGRGRHQGMRGPLALHVRTFEREPSGRYSVSQPLNLHLERWAGLAKIVTASQQSEQRPPLVHAAKRIRQPASGRRREPAVPQLETHERGVRQVRTQRVPRPVRASLRPQDGQRRPVAESPPVVPTPTPPACNGPTPFPPCPATRPGSMCPEAEVSLPPAGREAGTPTGPGDVWHMHRHTCRRRPPPEATGGTRHRRLFGRSGANERSPDAQSRPSVRSRGSTHDGERRSANARHPSIRSGCPNPAVMPIRSYSP
jgi:hypothetical protein